LLIAGILCFAACNNDIEIPEESEEAEQCIELFVPDAQEVSVYSAATVSECMIDTVCVFKADSSISFIEKIDSSQVTNNGQATQLLPQLKQ
jgi:hypothetical protein